MATEKVYDFSEFPEWAQHQNKLTEKQVSVALDSMTGESLTQFATTRLATAERFGRSLSARIRDHQWGSNEALITAGTGTREASHLSADPLRPEGKAMFGVAMLGVGPMGTPSVGSDAKEDSWIRLWIEPVVIFQHVGTHTVGPKPLSIFSHYVGK